MSTTQTSADYHQAQPIEVLGVDATHIYLGNGASVGRLSRGEVRTLKSFERRLEEKVGALTASADKTKVLKAHADQQAANATTLLEQARSVKGGEKLVGSLTRLAEAATVQAGKAEHLHQRALRAADACRAVLANVTTRYGGIYKAVVDSDVTAPAELAFYKD